MVTAAALFVCLHLADRLAGRLDLRHLALMDIDFGELQEFYFALFLNFYVYSMFRRVWAHGAC